jgi:hypothetical protein
MSDDTTPASLTPPAGGPAHVSQDDLDFLASADPCSPSPYRGVYREGGGWVAKAFKRRLGAVQSNPRDAAKLVVRYWRAHYGGHWRGFFAYRQTAGWTLSRVGKHAWWVVAFVNGSGVLMGESRGRLAPATSAGARPFASRSAAARAVRAWADDTYGGRAATVLRRRWAPTHNPGRLSPVPA